MISLRKSLTLNAALYTAGIAALIVLVYFVVWLNHTIEVRNDPDAQKPKSSLAGLPCALAHQRPVGVMFASDTVARPLSGIGAADIVVEMPVTPDGITRMMGIFQCHQPTEIGSIRSARSDFIPLIAGFHAVYAHWGGEQDALAQLNKGIVDNVNGLIYDGTIFFRKSGVPPPHNGFTSFTKLQEAIAQLQYSTDDTFTGYPHRTTTSPRSVGNIVGTIDIPYAGEFAVSWKYDATTNSYLRTRGGTPEIDAVTKEQVRASVVVVMETSSEPLRDQYINVRTQGSGIVRLFQDGIAIQGHWQKDTTSLDSKLTFTDGKGNEVAMTPGVVWVEITTGNTQ